MNRKTVTNDELGYDKYFESGKNNLEFSKYSVARVMAEYRGGYRVKNEHSEYYAIITGKQMYTATHRNDYPAVGDWVVIDELREGQAVIHGILPRKTILQKKYNNKQENQIIATNIDVAFIVESMDRDYNLNRFERFLVIAQDGNIQPTIILNKCDLISENELQNRMKQLKNRFTNIELIATSIYIQPSITELKKYIKPGKTYCFLGSSGVGKSSLINELLGKNKIKTSEINPDTERGKHTTTTREMHFMEGGGILIDNPGIREVGMTGSDTGIDKVFNEIDTLSRKCKFADCSHTNEPGCAVLKALEEKILDENRYENYTKLHKEAEYYKMTDLEKREKDRKFGKFVKKALQELKHS